jgi:GT2 family glycosyltransferase
LSIGPDELNGCALWVSLSQLAAVNRSEKRAAAMQISGPDIAMVLGIVWIPERLKVRMLIETYYRRDFPVGAAAALNDRIETDVSRYGGVIPLWDGGPLEDCLIPGSDPAKNRMHPDCPQMERPGAMPYASRAVVATSPSLDTSIGIVVCIPSFRRPQHLRLTLESLARQNTGRRFAVVIVENDVVNCGSVPVATEFLASGQSQGLCVVEPRQGNCHAINAAFETALAIFPKATSLLMIDDDEIASKDWLELMVQSAETTAADVVGGPVWPEFDDDSKRGLRHHPAFRPAYDTSGPVPVIYGCGNCLIKRSVFASLGDPTFDLRFNFLGGGDCDFFTRCRQAGFRFHWAAEAVIVETVPKSRSNIGWLMRRGLKIGAINYQIQRKAARTVWSRTRLIAKMFAMLPFSLFRAARLVLSERKAIAAMHPMTVAVGSALATLGFEPQPYEASKIIS